MAGSSTDRGTREAADDDLIALVDSAFSLLHGLNVPRDPEAANRLLRKAAGRGHAAAARAKAHLVAAGVGCRADPEEARRLLNKVVRRDTYAAKQLDLLKRVKDVGTPRRHILSESPEIVLVERLLAPEECAYIISLAEPKVKPSVIVADGRLISHPARTSHGCNFFAESEDLVLNRINRRIAAVTGTAYEWGEPLQILRYAVGQEYRPHLDTLPGVSNQRFWTALVYLNSGYKGGATDFPALGIQIEGAAGDALLFRSLDERGRPDQRTRHAGLPVTSGVKWLATRWIRQSTHDWWDDGATPSPHQA